MRVILDANICSKWESADKTTQERFMAPFRTGAVKFAPSFEFVLEILGIGRGGDSPRLRSRADWLRTVANAGFSKRYGEQVLSELLGEEDIALPPAQQNKILGLLEDLSKAKSRSDLESLLTSVQDEKDSHELGYKEIQEAYRKAFPKLPGILKDVSFEEFDEKYWNKWGRSLMIRLFQRFGQEHPDEFLDEVLRTPSAYPRTSIFRRITSGLLYRYSTVPGFARPPSSVWRSGVEV